MAEYDGHNKMYNVVLTNIARVMRLIFVPIIILLGNHNLNRRTNTDIAVFDFGL